MHDATRRRALLISNHAQVIGGGEASFLTLVKGLLSTSWTPVVVVPCPGEVGSACRKMGVETHEIPLPSLRVPGPRMLKTLGRLRRLIGDSSSSLVHANGSRAMFYGGMAARQAGIPCVWHVRILKRDPLLDAILVRLATATISGSQAGRERLAHWPWALERCHVVPNGLDVEGFAPQDAPTEIRTALDIPPDVPLVVSVGRLIREKTPDLLLDVAGLTARTETSVHYLIVGDGPMRSELEARAGAERLNGNVHFLGHRDDIASILDASDLFVMTSAIDHFGRVVIEAMARRLPVVAVARGGPAEIVADGETGMLVEPHNPAALSDAIVLLMRDAALRARMGEQGLQRVLQRYSMECHVGGVTRLYEDLIEPSGEDGGRPSTRG